MADSLAGEFTHGLLVKVGPGLAIANVTGTFMRQIRSGFAGKKLGWAILGFGSLATSKFFPSWLNVQNPKSWPWSAATQTKGRATDFVTAC